MQREGCWHAVMAGASSTRLLRRAPLRLVEDHLRNMQSGPDQVPDPDPAAAEDRPDGDHDDGGGEAGRDLLRHRRLQRAGAKMQDF